MKVTYKNEGVVYEPHGHYDTKCIRLHEPAMTGGEKLLAGITYFLPEGGRADFADVVPGMEIIYYVLEGEMTIETNAGDYVLRAGDSIFFKEGDGRAAKNTGTDPAKMLVIIAK